MRRQLGTLVLLATLPLAAPAVQVCDIDGQHVNPSHGGTTAGKTGLMRCREGEGGPVVREQELRNGVFMGIVRYFKGGVLQREHSVNERGNRDGLAREFAATAGPANPILREETLRNSTTVGLARSWFANGQLRRASFHGDDGREQAVAEFTSQGQLSELRCATAPQLAPAADDAMWCGHAGGTATVPTYAANGTLRGRLTHERGELRRRETLWENGKLRDQAEIGREGGVERSFSAEGVKRREAQWIAQADSAGRARRITVLDQEFHESGTLVRERRWQPDERGASLRSERRWYLNGQPRETIEMSAAQGQPLQRETQFHDNGKPASEGTWRLTGRYDRQAVGVHRHFDDQGRPRLERHHDDKGRVIRERELDEAGRIIRDDELFEDGSRKAVGR
jgi:antitoxin component YwqK of YwqJK toxin-antitoxin module